MKKRDYSLSINYEVIGEKSKDFHKVYDSSKIIAEKLSLNSKSKKLDKDNNIGER